MSNSEEEILATMKRDWLETQRFFSNQGKSAREQWVATEFLRLLNVPFSADELALPEQHSKIDVAILGANFQVKEITNPGTKRGAEMAATAKRVLAATTLQDTIGPGFVYDTPAPVSGYDLIVEQSLKLSQSKTYSGFRSNLDLLFYVTRTGVSLIRPEQVDCSALEAQGWRSISCLMGNFPLVLYAGPSAPGFLTGAFLAARKEVPRVGS